MKKSITKRIKLTGTGKVIKRHMAMSHFKVRKSSKQMRRKKPSQMYSSDVRTLRRIRG